MFEKELERARKSLKQQLVPSTSYLAFSSIVGNGALHPAYRTYFGAEVAWWVYEERALRSSNSRFDTDDVQYKEVFSRLDEVYLRTARFDHEELTATIDAATKVRLNYLCRPRTTLKWFVYRGEPTKPLHEVVLRLSYFHDYPYLTDGIRAWASARGADGSPMLEILSIVEFERIVEKVDNDAILDLSQQEFVRLLEPLYEYFAETNPETPPESVPTEAVIIFLDDKGAVPISQELERLLYREQLKWLTRTKFLEVVDTVIEDIERQTSAPTFSSSENTIIEQPDLPDTGVQLLKEELGIRLQKFQTGAEASQQKKFLEVLFGSNLERMDSVVSEILEASTWREAASRIDLWYARAGVDPNTAVAMEFAHALNQVYR